MADQNWKELLEKWNARILSSRRAESIPKRLIKRGWLGRTPATKEQIDALEKRIERKLPPSYRSFLEFSNGWEGCLTFSIDDLWSTEKVDWLRETYGEWAGVFDSPFDKDEPVIPDEIYFIYGQQQDPFTMRNEYLKDTLCISSLGDNALFLLNPLVTFGDEWEAWLLAEWLPGANRYRSFYDLMEAEYNKFVAHANYTPQSRKPR